MPSADAVVLPDNVRPVHYQITLQPYMDKFTFDGLEVIDIEVKEGTSEIVLNAAEMRVSAGMVIKDGRWIRASAITQDEETETVNLAFPETIAAGPAQLDLRFAGELNDKLRGFYRSQYVNPEGEVSYLATTQFEATDARRAFPCWDEPACKATFQLTLNIPANLVAVSNTPILEQAGLDAGFKSVMFNRTPIMSTYLMAFVVGDLTYLEQEAVNNTTVSVWTTRGKEEQGRFALETSARMLEFFNDYFGIPYPLEKLDHIAIPDFAAGAMENWGCVTYRETALLVDPANSSAGTRQRVAEVVAHEMAHMWFGDLVTMEWWDDLWLNESFASWMGTKAVDWLFPEWEMWTQFLTHDTSSALNLDGLRNSHPIEQPVNNPAEIGELFDAISYSKGGSVLRMLEHYLGEDDFREGLRLYIQRHQYANARTRDLWNALGEASGQPVAEIMYSWTSQTGYPVLEASVNRSGESIEVGLSQSRFLYDEILDESEEQDTTIWKVPVTARTASDAEPVRSLMDAAESGLTLRPASYGSGDEWVKVNPDQSGFFRVQYSDEEIERLKAPIASLTLPARDRLGLQSDAYALAKAGRIPASAYLNLVEAYSNENDASVASDLAAALNALDNLLSTEIFHTAYQAFGRRVFKPIGDRAGWDARTNEGHRDALLRSTALAQLGHFEDEATLSEARRRFDAYVEDPSSLSADLRVAAFSMAAQRGDQALYDTMWDLEKSASLHEEKLRFLRALSGFPDPRLIQETLDRSLDDDHVRSQDTISVMVATATNPHGRELAWQFLKDNWDEFDRRYGEGGFAIMRLVSISGVFTTSEKREEVREFFDTHPVPSAERTIRQVLERMSNNIAWLDKNRDDLSDWLVG
jgi:puromycin-sensitive aminopeptidase